MKTCRDNITLTLENVSDGHISILGSRKKYVTSIILRIFFEMLSYWKEKWFDITTNTIQYKNGAEWLKYECPSNIINFRCLLLKADFRIFYFELETLLNKLVKLCGYFGYECFISIKKVNLFSNRPLYSF